VKGSVYGKTSSKKTCKKVFKKIDNKHIVNLIAGIDPNPSHAIFYLRMESKDKRTGKTIDSVKPIWLSLTEMQKLSMLMFIASRFWEETYEKGSEYSKKRISDFIEVWDIMEKALDVLFEE